MTTHDSSPAFDSPAYFNSLQELMGLSKAIERPLKDILVEISSREAEAMPHQRILFDVAERCRYFFLNTSALIPLLEREEKNRIGLALIFRTCAADLLFGYYLLVTLSEGGGSVGASEKVKQLTCVSAKKIDERLLTWIEKGADEAQKEDRRKSRQRTLNNWRSRALAPSDCFEETGGILQVKGRSSDNVPIKTMWETSRKYYSSESEKLTDLTDEPKRVALTSLISELDTLFVSYTLLSQYEHLSLLSKQFMYSDPVHDLKVFNFIGRASLSFLQKLFAQSFWMLDKKMIMALVDI